MPKNYSILLSAASTSPVTVASGNVTFTEPTGAAQGDLIVCTIAYRGNAAFSDPASWLNVTSQNTGNTLANSASGVASLYMACIVRGASAPALTFNRTGGDVATGRLTKITPVNGTWPTDPRDASTSSTMSSGSTSHTFSGITTGFAPTLLFAFGAGGRNTRFTSFSTATDPLTGAGDATNFIVPGLYWTRIYAAGTATGADTNCDAWYALKDSAGATGNASVTAVDSALHAFALASFKLDAAVNESTIRTTKVQGFALINPPDNAVSTSKLTGYAVTTAVVNELRVSKITGYAVVKEKAALDATDITGQYVFSEPNATAYDLATALDATDITAAYEFSEPAFDYFHILDATDIDPGFEFSEPALGRITYMSVGGGYVGASGEGIGGGSTVALNVGLGRVSVSGAPASLFLVDLNPTALESIWVPREVQNLVVRGQRKGYLGKERDE